MDRTGRRYTQFKGVKKYKELVLQNEKLSNAYDKIKVSTKAKNEIRGKINDIKISEDWIKMIEEYLPYLSGCIQEQRKFIKNQSDVVPIEKAKKVGRESVIDLAMHSKNIRTIDKHGDIEPSKILVVERLDDYSVYENKFLCFLLKYLKSFIEIRFDKIREAKSLYETTTTLTNEVNLYRNNISYNIEIHDNRFSDLNLESNDKNTILIQRIQNLQVVINQLLKTELIEMVSKTPSIRPPIQKTNVLKNDPNFSRAVELYEYVTNYSEPGFEITPVETVKTEFSEEYLGYFSMIPTLLTFLSYAEIKDLFQIYDEEFQREIDDLRQLELEKNLRKIHELIGKDELDTKLIYEAVIQMEAQKIFLEKKIKEQEENHKKEIEDINQAHLDEIADINKNCDERIQTISDETQIKIDECNKNMEELTNKHAEEINSLNLNISSLEGDIKTLEEEKNECLGRLRAIEICNDSKFEENEISVDYFNALEAQKKAFDAYFAKKTAKVKRVIRKDEMKKAREEVNSKKKKKGSKEK